MRVIADLFISALLRRVFASGGFGAVVKRGAFEAGAVFFIERVGSGEAILFGPASQTDYLGAKPEDRRFRTLVTGAQAEVDARLVKEQRFDPDVWIVEIEPGNVPVRDLIDMVEP